MLARPPYAADERHSLFTAPDTATGHVQGVEGTDPVIRRAVDMNLLVVHPIESFRELHEIRGCGLFEINGNVDVLDPL